MSVRQSQAAWLDKLDPPSLTDMRIARTRVDRLSRRNKELNYRVKYQNSQIVNLEYKIKRLQDIIFMLTSIIKLLPSDNTNESNQTIGPQFSPDSHQNGA